MPGYYDVDSILAEEELIPCATKSDFSYLGHLDDRNEDHLPAQTRLHLPLWAVRPWAKLGYVKLSIPSLYSRRMREQLVADPTGVDLREHNERYFLTGRLFVELLDQHCDTLTESMKSRRSSGLRRGNEEQRLVIERLRQEAEEIRNSLVKTYSGDRLAKIVNWSLSVDDSEDISVFTARLTRLERRLFAQRFRATGVSSRQKSSLRRSRVVSPEQGDNKKAKVA